MEEAAQSWAILCCLSCGPRDRQGQVLDPDLWLQIVPLGHRQAVQRLSLNVNSL